MARRYTRVLQLDQCTEGTVDGTYDELANLTESLCDSRFNSGSWQIATGDDHNVLDLIITKDSFQGRVGVHRAAEVNIIPGQGSERVFNAKVSAECCNLKRQRAREMELGGQHKLGAMFGVIGGIIACVLWTILQIIAIQGILGGRALIIYICVFVVGSAIGGAIGTMLGGKIGKTAGAMAAQSSQSEENRFDDAIAAWEDFIGILVNSVDQFAQTVEERPSKATII